MCSCGGCCRREHDTAVLSQMQGRSLLAGGTPIAAGTAATTTLVLGMLPSMQQAALHDVGLLLQMLLYSKVPLHSRPWQLHHP